MIIHWAKVLPVIASIFIIIAIAILRELSPRFAAIVAVMPINVPLGMWILVAGREDAQQALTEFTEALFINIIPSLFFMVVAWQMSRAGYGLVPTIAAGYAVWAIGLLIIFALQAQFGR